MKKSKKILSVLICIGLMLALFGCKDSNTQTDISASTDNSETSDSSVTPSVPEESTSEKTDRPKFNYDDKLIALTFDDGPYSAYTDKILDTLEENGAVATFFVLGDRADLYKSSIKRAHDIGCEFGSHTYSHKNLTKLTVEQINSEMSKSAAAIREVIGEDIKIMRPPEGAVNDTVKANVGYPMIMWSIDSNDWRHKTNSDASYHEVYDYVFDGAIILMHDIQPGTPAAVARLVPDLMAKGYTFVTVSELMEARGIEMQDGEKYSSAKPKIQETTEAESETSSEASSEYNSYAE